MDRIDPEARDDEARPVDAQGGRIVPVGEDDAGRGPDGRTADLRESQELFRLAVESCPSGMVMIDGAGKIVLLNSAIERLFGYPRGELIGQPVDVLVPERLRRQHILHRDGFTGHPAGAPMGRAAICSADARTAPNFASRWP